MYELTQSLKRLCLNPLYWPLALVCAFTFAYSCSFLNIYGHPHSYDEASKWIYNNIPAHSKLIGVHWDDRLPVSLPDYDSGKFENNLELPLYEADNIQKMQLVASRMALGDYLILPTQRLQGSLMRVPQEFPQTSSFFQQLFAGQLGYRLIRTFKVRPSFLGFSFDDDEADESFSVYDHPKVSIFKNVERLTSDELQRRIYSPPLASTMPSLSSVMRTDAPPRSGGNTSHWPLIVQIVVWFSLIEIMGYVVFPFVAAAMPNSIDRGFGASKILGLLLFAYCAWILTSLKLIQTEPKQLWLLLLALIMISALFASLRFGNIRNWLHSVSQQVSKVQLLWLCTVFIFLVIRSYQPEIFWGEKPMDSTFLNFFTRLTSLPPQDPWAAGQPMHYYYFGTFLISLLLKLGAVAPSVGFNLSIASLAGLMVCASYSLFCRLQVKGWVIILCALGLPFLSNLEVVNLLRQGKVLNFDLFWASSRLFTSPAITEYPLWSLLFADLHAHLIALPCTLGVLTLGLALFNSDAGISSLEYWILRIMYGVSWGSLFILNSWDFITFSLVTALILGFRKLVFIAPTNAFGFLAELSKVCFEGLLCAGVAVAAVSPFLIVSFGAIKSGSGWVSAEEFNKLPAFFSHLGQWMVPLFLGLLAIFGRPYLGLAKASLKSERLWRISGSALFGAAPLIMGLFSTLNGTTHIPWNILIVCSVFILLLTWHAAGPNLERSLRSFLVPGIAGFLLITFAELRFLNDHMNTIFKFYNQIWLLVGLSALAVMPLMVQVYWSGFKIKVFKICARLALLLPASALGIALLGSILNIEAMTTFHRTEGPRPALDGDIYLNHDDPDTANAVAWINSNISGTPVMLEAFGPSYQDYSRITMHTGLPIVLGWEYHISQRGTPAAEIEKRKFDVRSIYSSVDYNLAYTLLRKYNVQLIVIGKLERETYSSSGLQKFEHRPELFPLVFRSGELSIYTTNYAQLGLKILDR